VFGSQGYLGFLTFNSNIQIQKIQIVFMPTMLELEESSMVVRSVTPTTATL
jgi:hypothetical protein